MITEFNQAKIFGASIVTQINGAETFYPAEDYHQYYFDKNPSNPYCLAVAAPKAAKIRAKYTQLIKN
jgi:peptide-methionine (S)-S-oxide reductase